MHPGDGGAPHRDLPVNVLVAVDDQARRVQVDVVGQGVEALVDAVLAVVDASWTVMRDQNVHRQNRHRLGAAPSGTNRKSRVRFGNRNQTLIPAHF